MLDYSDFSQSSTIDPIYLEPLTTVFYVTSSVSLVSNLIVCIFHGFMVLYQVAELNRVSLRLIVTACISGVVYSIFRFAMVISADTLICSVDTFFVTCTDLVSPFCLSMVGVHAVCVLVLNVNDPRRLEKYYYALILIYSIVATVVAVAASPDNYPERYPCWIRYYFGKKDLQRFNWIWYYILLILPIALSALCSLILLIRYKMERYNFATTSVRYAQNNNPFLLPVLPNRYNITDPIKTFRDVIIRSTFYTLIPFFSKILTFVTGFSNLGGHFIGYQTLVAAGVITTLQGFLVSILYFSDPAVIYTIRRFSCFLRRVYVDDYYLPPKKPVESVPRTSPIDNMWMSRYDEDDTWMGDETRCAAIRLSRVNHDMIAEDNMEDLNNRCQRRRSTYQIPVNFNLYPRDPYHCRCFAKMMHWFLTKVCRLKPPSFDESTSTLSYHSQPFPSSSATQRSLPLTVEGSNDKQSSKVSLSSEIEGNSNESLSPETGKNVNELISEVQVKTKKKTPVVQFNTEIDRIKKKPSPTTSSPIYATSDDANRYLTPDDSRTIQKPPPLSIRDSMPLSGSSPTSFSPPMRWNSPRLGQTKSSDSPTSSCRIARQSKKLRHVMLHRHHDSGQGERKASIATLFSTSRSTNSFTSSSSPSNSSILSSKPPSLQLPTRATEEYIDRLSLLSSNHSTESSDNKGYQPLSAPPRQQRHPDEHLPTLSITLPDANTPEEKDNNEDDDEQEGQKDENEKEGEGEKTVYITSPLASTLSNQPHGVQLDPSTVRSLIDWEPTSNFYPARSDRLLMEPDGIEHGWTSLIHIRQFWEQVNSNSNNNSSSGSGSGSGSSNINSDRIIPFVEHWVKDYLGSRWFVVE